MVVPTPRKLHATQLRSVEGLRRRRGLAGQPQPIRRQDLWWSNHAACPACREISTARHSSYWRKLQDLPTQGAAVTLKVRVGRWKCLNSINCRAMSRNDSPARIARSISATAGWRQTVQVCGIYGPLTFQFRCCRFAFTSPTRLADDLRRNLAQLGGGSRPMHR
jgi:zinc-finger of transposase IS204/IS1001/IS1096/IS1165